VTDKKKLRSCETTEEGPFRQSSHSKGHKEEVSSDDLNTFVGTSLIKMTSILNYHFAFFYAPQLLSTSHSALHLPLNLCPYAKFFVQPLSSSCLL